MKTIWVVERTDNNGEFQPVHSQHSLSREHAIADMEILKKQDKKYGVMNNSKYRVMQYIRKNGEA